MSHVLKLQEMRGASDAGRNADALSTLSIECDQQWSLVSVDCE